MTELKDLGRELDRFRARLLAAGLFVLLAFGILSVRLVWLQVFRHEDLAQQAEANRIAVVPVVPNRGLIVDRKLRRVVRKMRRSFRRNSCPMAA